MIEEISSKSKALIVVENRLWMEEIIEKAILLTVNVETRWKWKWVSGKSGRKERVSVCLFVMGKGIGGEDSENKLRERKVIILECEDRGW